MDAAVDEGKGKGKEAAVDEGKGKGKETAVDEGKGKNTAVDESKGKGKERRAFERGMARYENVSLVGGRPIDPGERLRDHRRENP